MKNLQINKLRENNITDILFPVDTSFELLLQSIELEGIKEPLVVKDDHNGFYTIISGIRRFRCGLRLGLTHVPVVISEVSEITEELVLTHQIQRIKTPSQIIRDYLLIKEKYNLRQGTKIKTPELVTGRKMKKLFKEVIGKTKMDLLIKIHYMALELYGKGDNYNKVWEKLDRENNISSMIRHLEQVKTERQNKKLNLVDKNGINEEGFIVRFKSSDNLIEMDDNSVQTIFTSPPYWRMRDYETDNQLGLSEFDHFVKKLAIHFDECFRVLKTNGSLFVNLGDKIEDGNHYPLAHLFGYEMKKRNWIWNDTIVWFKNNSQYTHGSRSSTSHEYILHFVKNPKGGFYYNTDWLTNPNLVPEEYHHLLGLYNTVGYDDNCKLKSVFVPELRLLRSNTSHNSELRRECENQGYVLDHSATFPVNLPLMGILCTSRPGDLVLDIFNGTGTTGEVALKTGRKYVGYDNNLKYVNFTKIRYDMTIRNLRNVA